MDDPKEQMNPPATFQDYAEAIVMTLLTLGFIGGLLWLDYCAYTITRPTATFWSYILETVIQ